MEDMLAILLPIISLEGCAINDQFSYSNCLFGSSSSSLGSHFHKLLSAESLETEMPGFDLDL